MVAHSETGWSRRCGITPVKSRSRQQEYAPRFLRAHLLLDVVPNLGGGEVLAAEGVRVDLRGGGDGRVAEAFADGRQVHAFFQQEARVAVADRVEAGSLGEPLASGKAWRPFPTTPEAYRARLQHSQMTLRRVSRLLVFSWGLSRCGGAWAHSPLPSQRRSPQRSWAHAVDELIQQEEEDPVGRVLHSLLPAASPLT